MRALGVRAPARGARRCREPGRGAAASATQPPRGPLIETCCQSDKHICIQSIYFPRKGLQSAVG